jgi:hypothetical protein
MKRLILITLVSLAATAQAQQLNIFPDNAYGSAFDKYLNQKDAVFHTSMRPYLQADVEKVIGLDSAVGIGQYKGRFPKTRVGRALFSDHLLKLDSGIWQLYLDPVIDVDMGRDASRKITTYTATKGAAFSGNIGKKFSFYTAYYENQARFAGYLGDWITANTVIPGQGRPKPFKTGGWDYGYATGYVSYTPTRYLNIQAGNGKNFIGDGYRSLLLSDNSFNYPYLKLTANIWRIKYSIIYAQFQDIRTVTGPNQTYAKKNAVMHYFDIMPHKRLSIGLFESVIWENRDSATGAYRGFDPNYLNPLIFFRPVEYSLGSPDNVIIGLNLKYNFTKNQVLYSQIVLDEFYLKEVKARNGWWANKQGFQLGFKSFDLFGVKNLNLQTEFNWVRPYTYTHFSTVQNYAHYNQPLAHPLGANFWESVSFLRYKYKRLWFQGELMFARFGTDGPTDNYGGNLYKPYTTRNNEYGNFVGQGIKNTMVYADFTASYIINPVYGLRLEAGATARRQTVEGGTNNNTLWVHFGIKTWLPAKYYDY